MTYPVTLWRCALNFGAENANGCSGFRYVEVGQEPGRCGQETVHRPYPGSTHIITRQCPSYMVKQGEYELYEEVAI